MGMILSRRHGARREAVEPAPPASVTWSEHQRALQELTVSYERKLTESAPKGETEELTVLRDENEQLKAKLAEMEAMLEDLTESAPKGETDSQKPKSRK